MKINICFSSDDNYAKYMATAIVSIMEFSKSEDEYNFYILDGGIKNAAKKKLK